MDYLDFLLGLLLIVAGSILSKKIEVLVHMLKRKVKEKKGSNRHK